jgi:hypothetical protein
LIKTGRAIPSALAQNSNARVDNHNMGKETPMRVTSLIACVPLALFVCLGATSSAPAIDRKGVAPAAPTTTRKMAPLTEGECTGLGGKVETSGDAFLCGSKKLCATVDHNGVIRQACISVAK